MHLAYCCPFYTVTALGMVGNHVQYNSGKFGHNLLFTKLWHSDMKFFLLIFEPSYLKLTFIKTVYHLKASYNLICVKSTVSQTSHLWLVNGF